MRRMMIASILLSLLVFVFAACADNKSPASTLQIESAAQKQTSESVQSDELTMETDTMESSEAKALSESEDVIQAKEESAEDSAELAEEAEKMLCLKIGETAVNVEWEDNESVESLRVLCSKEPLTIQMSMYDGFEQVGPVGNKLPSNDAQTSTSAGDIVLYSSNQIVVFYGSNSWTYTRLGHITDQDAAGMKSLLGNGDVSITLSMEESK